MTKVPTRSPTHADLESSRVASMGLEIEDVADGVEVAVTAIIELAEERGRPASHYLAAIALATELRVAGSAPLQIRVCAGTCQRYGALDVLDHLAARWERDRGARFAIVPVACLDRCDAGPACEIDGAHGRLVIAPATAAALDEALDDL
jgi:NADH:ubiquinone oxidoreductase subunit E